MVTGEDPESTSSHGHTKVPTTIEQFSPKRLKDGQNSYSTTKGKRGGKVHIKMDKRGRGAIFLGLTPTPPPSTVTHKQEGCCKHGALP